MGLAEIWPRTCQAEETAKMLKRKQIRRVCEDQQRPELVKEGRVREKTGGGAP